MKREHALAGYAGLDHALERPDKPPAADRGLASTAQVRKFLCDLVNTRDEWTAIRRFFDQHGRVLPGPIWRDQDVRDEHRFWRTIPADCRLSVFQEAIRRAWQEPDGRKRNRILIPILAPFICQPHQPRTVIDQAFWYLIDDPDRTRVCPNKECPARYFFAARRGQRYCSSSCAEDAQRAYKRKWWTEHGPGWRQKRKKQPARKPTRRHR